MYFCFILVGKAANENHVECIAYQNKQAYNLRGELKARASELELRETFSIPWKLVNFSVGEVLLFTDVTQDSGTSTPHTFLLGRQKQSSNDIKLRFNVSFISSFFYVFLLLPFFRYNVRVWEFFCLSSNVIPPQQHRKQWNENMSNITLDFSLSKLNLAAYQKPSN